MAEDTREAQRAVVLPVCRVSLGCGQRQEAGAHGAHLAVRADQDPAARGERETFRSAHVSDIRESPKALWKESSESAEVALGAQALSSFLKEAFTCRVSTKSTGTSSQFREESTLRP
ncbi:hypothetical protein EYF80_003071 [Liparis tanakae]|uniref:Uncharacterized protein n=1 Tax=Liparis tanakae TaxID=230148 RepID=A0A4Z2JA57_9TELE|nr:hypothetical protein EYF80_003071 [Liparis tanakae]